MSPFVRRRAASTSTGTRPRTIPVLLQHGTDDPMIPVSQRPRARPASWSSTACRSSTREYPMGHQVALESVQQARAWLDAGPRRRAAVGAAARAAARGPGEAGDHRRASTPRCCGSDVPVIVDFWAPWCGPCRQVGPIVEQIARMREGAYKVVKVNIDEEPTLAQQYDVQSIPLIGLFRNGRLERAVARRQAAARSSKPSSGCSSSPRLCVVSRAGRRRRAAPGVARDPLQQRLAPPVDAASSDWPAMCNAERSISQPSAAWPARRVGSACQDSAMPNGVDPPDPARPRRLTTGLATIGGGASRSGSAGSRWSS